MNLEKFNDVRNKASELLREKLAQGGTLANLAIGADSPTILRVGWSSKVKEIGYATMDITNLNPKAHQEVDVKDKDGNITKEKIEDVNVRMVPAIMTEDGKIISLGAIRAYHRNTVKIGNVTYPLNEFDTAEILKWPGKTIKCLTYGRDESSQLKSVGNQDKKPMWYEFEIL